MFSSVLIILWLASPAALGAPAPGPNLNPYAGPRSHPLRTMGYAFQRIAQFAKRSLWHNTHYDRPFPVFGDYQALELDISPVPLNSTIPSTLVNVTKQPTPSSPAGTAPVPKTTGLASPLNATSVVNITSLAIPIPTPSPASVTTTPNTTITSLSIANSITTVPTITINATPPANAPLPVNTTFTITEPISIITLPTVTLPPTSTETIFVTAPPITISPGAAGGNSTNSNSTSISISIVTTITVTASGTGPVTGQAVTQTVCPEVVVGETVTLVETETFTASSNGVVATGTQTFTSLVVIPNSVTGVGSSVVSGVPIVTGAGGAPAGTEGSGGVVTSFQIVFVTVEEPLPNTVTVYSGTTTVTLQ